MPSAPAPTRLFLARHGGTTASDAGLADEYGGGPAFQVLELAPGSLSGTRGLVRYAPAFAAFT